MSATWVDAEREAVIRREAEWRALAEPECRICRGQGKTRGWVTQGYVTYPCPCTGQASWQEPA